MIDESPSSGTSSKENCRPGGKLRTTNNEDETRLRDAEMKRIDAGNSKWMREIVAAHGWPGASFVGKDGASAACC